jgi:hypothetical protein
MCISELHFQTNASISDAHGLTLTTSLRRYELMKRSHTQLTLHCDDDITSREKRCDARRNTVTTPEARTNTIA